jgi:hypothetical protein
VLLDRQEPQELDRLGLQALRVDKVAQEPLELKEYRVLQELQESLEAMDRLGLQALRVGKVAQVLQEPLVDKVAQEQLV